MAKKILAVAVLLLVAPLAQADTVAVRVSGLVCDLCVDGIEHHLKQIPGVRQSFASLKDGLVVLDVPKSAPLMTTSGQAQIKEVLVDAGYTVHQISATAITLDQVRAQPAQSASKIWAQGAAEQKQLLQSQPQNSGETCGKKQAGFGAVDPNVWG